MTQEQVQCILDLSKKTISDLTVELTDELKKIDIINTKQDNTDTLVNCDGIIAKIKSRLDQLKSMLK